MKIAREFAGADFGDKRLTRRLGAIVDDVSVLPNQSFPDATDDDAALEGLYRFLGNESVTPGRILGPHVAATVTRIRAATGDVIIASDSSEFMFRREEMGPLGENRTGFLGHFSLAVTSDDAKEPLGCLGFAGIIRPRGGRVGTTRERRNAPDYEERRWWTSIDAAERAVAAPRKMIHVADREADNYELFAKLVAADYRFVLRMSYDRNVTGDQDTVKVTDVVHAAPVLTAYEVPVAERKALKRGAQRKSARSQRLATVGVSGVRVQLVRPRWTTIDGPPTLDVNVVSVRELEPPKGEEPVEWRLVTTEPIATANDLLKVVDTYRRRWTIEEFFRALKQGCAIEKRQLEGARSIVNAVALFTPIAWQLLALRSMSRQAPDRSASRYLTRLQIALLQHHPKIRLAKKPTVKDALYAIARLGGHIKNNGDPGWLVLGRGFAKLLALEEGASLASKM